LRMLRVVVLQLLGKITTTLGQDSHWCRSQHILPANNSLRCCLHHHTTACCTYLSNMNLRVLFTRQKMCKSHGGKSGLYARCLSMCHCMIVSWSWTLWASTIMQQDDAIMEIIYTEVFLDFGSIFSSIRQYGFALCLKFRCRVLWMILWSCLDEFTTWYAIFKLCCNLICSSYSFNCTVLHECLLM
jgi:hypothetical protein